MLKVELKNIAGQVIGEVELNESIFGIEPNMTAVHSYVKAYLANQRQGTQSALTRAQVSGGGIKPWRQKGTGNARQGSTRSPQWRHGGIVFAPKPRDYRMDLNKKVKRLALKSVLSDKAATGSIVVLDAIELEAAKTKEMVKVMKNLNLTNALVVLDEKNETVQRATANLPKIATTLVGTLNPYEILKHTTLVLTKAALEKVEEVYQG
ncbi:MAG: 50S ribosomal protein L4 [Eubacteriales bacterium]|nr:50S ribosomal protein L4 [Eubacteriales bacterium]MCI7570581.1 50S ribosomal protein L4 [Clostridiales bacterium]MDD7550849.1 50S ribosomal protein L4 [Clostridia bacterium]MDY5753856.1 50S ribosomal protein L4 [Eubacteriales bacterium]